MKINLNRRSFLKKLIISSGIQTEINNEINKLINKANSLLVELNINESKLRYFSDLIFNREY